VCANQELKLHITALAGIGIARQFEPQRDPSRQIKYEKVE